MYPEDVDFNKINDDPYKPVQEETVEEKVSDLTLENLSAQVGSILDRSIKIENKFMKDYKPDDTPVSKIENTFIMKENEETEENINSGKTGDSIASKVVKNVLAVDESNIEKLDSGENTEKEIVVEEIAEYTADVDSKTKKKNRKR